MLITALSDGVTGPVCIVIAAKAYPGGCGSGWEGGRTGHREEAEEEERERDEDEGRAGAACLTRVPPMGTRPPGPPARAAASRTLSAHVGLGRRVGGEGGGAGGRRGGVRPGSLTQPKHINPGRPARLVDPRSEGPTVQTQPEAAGTHPTRSPSLHTSAATASEVI